MDLLLDPVDSIATGDPVPLDLWVVTQPGLAAWLAARDAGARSWLESSGFKAERHQVALLPGPDGRLRGAVLGLGAIASHAALDLWHAAALPERLPAGTRWRLAEPEALGRDAATAFALGWACGSYRFDGYKGAAAPSRPRARLVAPAQADLALVERLARATAMARDFINMPACDMTPARLAEEALTLAHAHGATARVVQGEELARDFPTIQAVGQAAAIAPRLVDFCWGDAANPKVTLVGKGVCFDSGGLDIKPAAGMALMKKDMGGAACVLGLARAVMEAKLPVRLRVLVPAVENAIAGNALRPGDVIRTRKGITVEIGNTDAEGRLVLCDALALAEEEEPDLLIDLATLTGAARVALGPELPALYGYRQDTVDALLRHGRQVADPLWQLPLWAGYDDDLASKVADCNNASSSTFAGSIVAALYLRKFVAPTRDWLHVDLYAWNPKDRPGRPAGGEAQAVRALYSLLVERYG